ncbi:AbfB domain-containing protein [Streptomyces sp. NPDC050997]|uniref:AbfB domain-containing protein n=1 Tax=Streptomyces sp. NPDC050997 TaxID=3155519 RepID=UPI00343F863B
MPQSKSRPPKNPPWENGWVPDTSRVPGTRRLWLAAALAIATVVTCVTAITLTDQHTEAKSPAKEGTPAADTTGPGLISYASNSPTGAAIPPAPSGGKSGSPSARSTATTAPDPQGSASATSADPPKSPAPHPTSSTTKPSVTWRSVRSVNYPDRYWHVDGGYVGLDQVTHASARRDATFKLVKGLADASCYSFATSGGSYLRHREFVLRAERDDGSALFKQDATFCPRTSSVSGAVMLESVNYPGRFLRHKNFRLRLDPYQYSRGYQSDWAFRLVGGLA